VRAAFRTRPRSITQRQFLVLPATDGTQTAPNVLLGGIGIDEGGQGGPALDSLQDAGHF